MQLIVMKYLNQLTALVITLKVCEINADRNFLPESTPETSISFSSRAVCKEAFIMLASLNVCFLSTSRCCCYFGIYMRLTQTLMDW